MRALKWYLSGMLVAGVVGLPAYAQNQDRIIRDQVDLGAYTIQELDIPDQPGGMFDVTVDLGGIDYTIFLQPRSVRGNGYQILIDDGSGELVRAPAPTSRTYRGWIDGFTSDVGGSLLDEGLKVVVLLEAKEPEAWYIQPLREVIPSADRSQHIVYRAADSIARDWSCGVGDDGSHRQPQTDGGGQATKGLKIAELACDADYQFYATYNGSDQARTVSDVENVIAGVNTVYERDVNITHTITTIIVRTSSASNPYTSNDPGTLLNQFTNYWNANYPNIQRDVAELFTGRNMDGSVIGIAWLRGVCNNNGYNVVQSRFTTNYNYRVTLSAHELGHNWAAGHCDGTSQCHIMCSGIGGCNGIGLPNFGPVATGQISNYRDAVRCLDEEPDGYAELTWMTDRPEVAPGQNVTLSLWADWDPAGIGLSSTIYFIDGADPNTGSNTLNVTEDPGDTPSDFLGRNPNFRFSGTYPPYVVGDDIDADPSGVDCFQLPILFNPDFDASRPIELFRFTWRTSNSAERTVTYTSAHTNFDVYIDTAGSSLPYAINVNPVSFDVVASNCPPDYNGDGILNSQDFIAFLNDFVAGNMNADYNGDGTLNSQDFIAFLNDFVAGC